MKFSIITVCFNSRETISDSIDSILVQKETGLELIVIDGGSTDGTVDILKEYGNRISVLISDPDNGIYDAMNKGLSLATGDVVGILNSDDYYCRPDVLARVQQCLLQQPDADGVYSDIVYVDQQDKERVLRTWIAGTYSPGKFYYGWMPPHPGVFFKKEVYREVGYFNLQLKSAADYEFLLRACLKFGKKLAYMPGIVVHMRVGGMSNASLKNRLRANVEDRLAWEINGLKGGLLASLLKPFRKIGQFFK